jgi:DNA-directed RNA polymerase subunit RPC12/RpoP
MRRRSEKYLIDFHCISCGYSGKAILVEEREKRRNIWRGEDSGHYYACNRYVDCPMCGLRELINPFYSTPDIIKEINNTTNSGNVPTLQSNKNRLIRKTI